LSSAVPPDPLTTSWPALPQRHRTVSPTWMVTERGEKLYSPFGPTVTVVICVPGSVVVVVGCTPGSVVVVVGCTPGSVVVVVSAAPPGQAVAARHCRTYLSRSRAGLDPFSAIALADSATLPGSIFPFGRTLMTRGMSTNEPQADPLFVAGTPASSLEF